MTSNPSRIPSHFSTAVSTPPLIDRQTPEMYYAPPGNDHETHGGCRQCRPRVILQNGMPLYPDGFKPG